MGWFLNVHIWRDESFSPMAAAFMEDSIIPLNSFACVGSETVDLSEQLSYHLNCPRAPGLVRAPVDRR